MHEWHPVCRLNSAIPLILKSSLLGIQNNLEKLRKNWLVEQLAVPTAVAFIIIQFILVDGELRCRIGLGSCSGRRASFGEMFAS